MLPRSVCLYAFVASPFFNARRQNVLQLVFLGGVLPPPVYALQHEQKPNCFICHVRYMGKKGKLVKNRKKIQGGHFSENLASLYPKSQLALHF